jgi:hypothetical protein
MLVMGVLNHSSGEIEYPGQVRSEPLRNVVEQTCGNCGGSGKISAECPVENNAWDPEDILIMPTIDYSKGI